MNEKELIEFLKNNMRIELDENYRFDWDNNPTLTIKIFIKSAGTRHRPCDRAVCGRGAPRRARHRPDRLRGGQCVQFLRH